MIVKSPTQKAPENKSHSTLTQIFLTGVKDPGGFLKWLLVVAITGTLIGLGGPFWFDVARKLSDLGRKIRGGGGAAEPVKPEAPVDDPDKLIKDIAAETKPKTSG